MIRVTNVVTMEFVEVEEAEMGKDNAFGAINDMLDNWLAVGEFKRAREALDLFGLIVIDTEDMELRRSIVDRIDKVLKMRAKI